MTRCIELHGFKRRIVIQAFPRNVYNHYDLMAGDVQCHDVVVMLMFMPLRNFCFNILKNHFFAFCCVFLEHNTLFAFWKTEMDVPQILAKLFATDIKRVLFPLRYDESEKKHVSVVDNITLPPIEDDFGTTVKAKNTPYVEKWVECLFPMNRHMLRSILVGDSNVGQNALGSGSYAEVVSVHPIFGTFRPTLALKKARIADGDETAFEDLCEAAADQNDVQVWRKVEKLYSPKNNDVIAEPIITCVVSNNRVTRHFVPRFFGAACDSPMHALESGNSPNCYMWSECIKAAHGRTSLRVLDTLCRKAKTDAAAIDDAVNALAELETLVAHSMACLLYTSPSPRDS